MLISIRKRFIFVANSKTASTTIESTLQPYAELVLDGNPQAKHATWLEVKSQFSRLLEHPDYPPEKFMRFGVMREPADWILSWYNYRRFTGEARIPRDMRFEDFWHSDDWVKHINQSMRFLDSDGACRFDLLIPMGRLREALSQLFQSMGVEGSKEKVLNKSKGALKKSEVAPELWDEINEYYRADSLLYQKWQEKFDSEFPQVLDAFYGEGAEVLPELPAELRMALAGVRMDKRPEIEVAHEAFEDIIFIDSWLPEQRQVRVNGITLGGVVLLRPGRVPEGAGLLISDEAGTRKVEWGLRSPRIAERFSDNPLAKSCRFKASEVQVDGHKSAVLWLSLPNGERQRLATINLLTSGDPTKEDMH